MLIELPLLNPGLVCPAIKFPLALSVVKLPAPPLIASAPTSIAPNPLVILPLLSAPTVVRAEVPGYAVAFERLPELGVPNAPPFTTGAPAVPTATARAVATPVPGVTPAHVVRSAS